MKIWPVPCLQDNYAYLLVDDLSGDAAVVDPVEPERLVKAAELHGARIKFVITTHHHCIEEESVLFSQNRDYFARPIALKEESKQQAVSWWENNGRLTPTLQRLALRTLSQECTSGAAERIWSICADIHTRKGNKLSTSQLDKLVYVNADLRVLERLRLRVGNGGVL
ncbi:hypothetical protein L7F22_014495 [Adiantum nelumboides]|nr:hypothetical protein [Adiantum nelumboides]